MASLFTRGEHFWKMLWMDDSAVVANALICAGLKLPCAHAVTSGGGIVCNDCVEPCLRRARDVKCMLRVSSLRMSGAPARFYLSPFSDDAYRAEIAPTNTSALGFVREMLDTRAFRTSHSTKYMTQTDYGQCTHNEAMNVCNAAGILAVLLTSRLVFLEACVTKDAAKRKRLYDVLCMFKLELPDEDEFVVKFDYADFVRYFEGHFFTQRENTDKDER